MNGSKKEGRFDFARDPVVTACSLAAIIIQSLLIIFGFVYRWDWLAYECAAVLIIPSIIVTGYGVKAIINADKLMMVENKIETGEGSNGEA